jgi:uncharacterized integral membrane protein
MSSPPPAPSHRQRAQLIAAGVAVALAVVFALFNLKRVRVDWIFGSFQTPLIVVIVVTFALGLGAGLLVARRRAA